MTLLKKFIGWAFDRHAHTGPKCHNADYEVCPDLLCRLAVWLEATFNPYAAWHDGDYAGDADMIRRLEEDYEDGDAEEVWTDWLGYQEDE